MTALYGPVIDGETVRRAVESHLRTWMPTYLAEVGRQKSVTLAPLAGYALAAANELPVAVIACEGPTSPQIRGDGKVRATFPVAVGVVVSATTREAAQALAGYYGSAVVMAVMQHRSLSDFAADTTWEGSPLQEVKTDAEKSLVACVSSFSVTVNNVLWTLGGPLTAPVDPTATPAAIPTVDLAEIVTVRTT